MNLKERITDDMKAAMRARDSERLSAIRYLLAAIKQREVDERIEIDDAGVLAIIEKLLKQRRDGLSQFQSAGRQDLVDKEAFEIDLLEAYLPAPLSEAEVASAIDDAIRVSGAAGPKDMGRVMAVLRPKLAGRADIAKVSSLVKARLPA